MNTQRAIKFRAWDKLAKQFTYPDKGYQGHYVLDLNGRFQNLQNGSGGDEYVVQQFTGLKDKDGKEIYEGDRVRFTYVNVVDMIGGARIVDVFGEVQWCKNIASFGVLYEKYIEFKEMTNVEVMGNIFQLPCNPDHNGECLVCDSWLSDCPFNKNEQE